MKDSLAHDQFQTICMIHQCLFIRTRFAMSEGGFLMTIHNMMEVARDKLYLWRCLSIYCPCRRSDIGTKCEEMRTGKGRKLTR